MDALLSGLRAAGEHTRLRLLALLDGREFTVSEITRIVGQSQPRVSRHLKLLCESGLLERTQEGAWAFYRVAEHGPGAPIARALLGLLPANAPEIGLDRERLDTVREQRAAAADAYFAKIASNWDRLRNFYVEESEVEQAMLDVIGDEPIADHLDAGTGTGRILELFAERADRGLGIDLSREMLAIARANLDRRGLRHCRVRRGDIYHLAMPAGWADLVTIHHVLHFLDDPGAAIREGSRALRPGGRILIVDFAPHHIEHLRIEHAHRRLGFADEQVHHWCESAGLVSFQARHLRVADAQGEQSPLTVALWVAAQRGDAPAHYELEVA